MAITGVNSGTSTLVQSLVDMRNKLDDLQTQLGTGLKSQNYAGLGSGSGLTVALNAQLSAMSSYDDTITNVGLRLNLAQTALGQISTVAQNVASSMSSTIDTSFNASGQTMGQSAASNQLDQMLGLLNTQAGDRYLFSGRATDQAATDTMDHILNGNGTQAGFKQVLSERNQADLGANGLGRLVIPAASGSTVSLSEDVAGSPFGFKLASATSSLTGATVTGPSGSPAGISVNLGATNPNAGDTIKFTFNLPDGTTQDLTLTATTSASPGPNEFTIGAAPAATAANLQAALTSSVKTLAGTSLAAASALAASNDFFNTDATHPPQRVAGPPFATATSLINGTSANTVNWYTGDDGTDPARSTAVARVDPSITVSYGVRANEQGLRSAIESVAVFASTTFSASDPNATSRYQALTQRLQTALGTQPGVQQISDIEAELAGAQTTIGDSKDRHQQTSSTLQDMLQQLTTAPQEQVAAQILALQTSLQASLQTTASLYKLSLVNFMPAA
jgi:flagellin-like hook-associated protein FlgL